MPYAALATDYDGTIARDGAVIARFSPTVKPDDPRVIDAIEGLL